MFELVKALDADAVAAGLDERPSLRTWRDALGRNWLHICCARNVDGDAARAEAAVRTAEKLMTSAS